MEIAIGAPLFKVEREYSANGKKIAYSESYFDANTFPDISSLYFNTPLYEQLRTNYGKAPTRLSEHYSFDIATETESILLEIEQSPAVITKIFRRSFDITNAIIDYTEILCHKRAFELTTDIKSIHTSKVGNYQSNIKFK